MISYRVKELEEELKKLRSLAQTSVQYCYECKDEDCKDCYSELCNDIIDNIDEALDND